MFLIIAIIVVFIILIRQNSSLKKENDNLKINNFNIVKFCPKCGFDLRSLLNRVNFCPKCGHNFNQAPPINNYQNNKIKEEIKKQKPTDKEVKNSLILTSGAILVIISAIAFLTSTWNITGSFVKTLILFLMLMVFFIVSYIADKYLNLKQTARTFYYIALSYIPIVFISISMFGLFGDYLSLMGEGRYIYLFFSSLIVALIYYFNLKKHNSILLFILSIIFQMLTVMFFALIFSSRFRVVILGLFVYNIVISILYLSKKIYFSVKAHTLLSIILGISLSIIYIFQNGLNLLFNNIIFIDFIICIVMLINLSLVLVKILKRDSIYKYIYPLIIILSFNNLSHLFLDNIMFIQALILASYGFVFIYNIIKESKINLITYLEVLVSFIIFYNIWEIKNIFLDNMLESYILFGVMAFFNLIHYVFNDKNKLFSAIMLSSGIIITAISLVMYFEFDAIILSLISFIFILISMYKNASIYLRNAFKWVGFVFLVLSSLIYINGNYIYSLIAYSIYSIVILVYGILKKKDSYKIFSYIYINIALLNIFNYAEINFLTFIIPSTTIILTILERLFNNIRSKASDIYLMISYIVSMILLLNTFEKYTNIAMLIISISFVTYICLYNKNKNLMCLPLIGFIPHIYFVDNLIIGNFNLLSIISIFVIAIICILMWYKKRNIYITMFYIYTFFYIMCYTPNNYISILIFAIGDFICYLIKNNKVKDIYKGLLYILGFALYNTILVDINLDSFSSLIAISYISLLILITRTIVKKYGNSYKVWEYIISILINLAIIFNYNSELDGIIYIIALAILVIVSYIYKLGPIFMVSVISLILNALLLTQILFINIPWWIYVLIIGSILISFAIYNESKDKTEKVDIKKHLDL